MKEIFNYSPHSGCDENSSEIISLKISKKKGKSGNEQQKKKHVSTEE
jgi:hypothetical protein